MPVIVAAVPVDGRERVGVDLVQGVGVDGHEITAELCEVALAEAVNAAVLAEMASRDPGPPGVRAERLLAGQKKCLENGLIGVHDAGVGATGVAAYEELAREGKLVLRAYVLLSGEDPALLEKRFAAKPMIGDRLTIRSVKLAADGALGSRGAALLAPYDDDKGNSGLLRMDASHIEAVTTKALEAGERELSEVARRLRQGTFFAVPKEQLSI